MFIVGFVVGAVLGAVLAVSWIAYNTRKSEPLPHIEIRVGPVSEQSPTVR